MLKKIISKIRGKEIEFSEQVNSIVLIKFLLRNFINTIRGEVKGIGTKHSKINCGKKVILRNKKYITFAGKAKIADYVEIDGLSKNGVSFGKNVSIGKYTIIRGSSNIFNIGKGIKIGDDFSIGDFSFFRAHGGIEIGNDVIMGQNIRFHAQNHNYEGKKLIRLQGTNSKGIKIGNNCWVGAGSVFLDGVTVGEGCVIGANSIITKDIPPNCIVVGQPARVIKSRSNGEEKE